MASLFKKKTVDGKFLAVALRVCLFGQNRPATLLRLPSTGLLILTLLICLIRGISFVKFLGHFRAFEICLVHYAN